MKRKGFTLVELLAVIAILAILVIIALPNVLKMYNDARKNSFLNEVNNLIGTTRQQYLFDSGASKTYSNAEGSTKTLNITGGKDLKYIIKTNSNGVVTKVQVTNGTYCYNKSGEIDHAEVKDVKDSDNCTLSIDNNYTAMNESVFIPGQDFNVKIKQLAGTDTSINGAGTVDTNITAILKSDTEPSEANKSEEHIVSTSDSKYPIYAWYDNGTIYYYSDSENPPALNENSRLMFTYISNLTNISGLSEVNTSNVTSMYAMFAGTSSKPMKLSDLTPLSNWDTSSVTSMYAMFTLNTSLTTLSGLENWDTSNVTNMSGMFQMNTSLTSLEGLENWDVSNVTNMSGMFMGQVSLKMKISDLTPLSNWDTSNVTNMSGMFQHCTSLTTLSGLEKWNISNVTNMSSMFIGTKITSVKLLENWNVSNVNNMAGVFYNNYYLTTLEGLENWDVSNVTNMSSMFNRNTSLTNADAIKDWDVRNVFVGVQNGTNTNNFKNMFSNNIGIEIPQFSKRPGNWSNGTYTPTN